MPGSRSAPGLRAGPSTLPPTLPPTLLRLVLPVLLLFGAAPAAAQMLCGEDAGGLALSAVAGPVRYELLGERTTRGVEAGVEAGARVADFAVRGGIHRVFLEGAPADPTTARVRAAREVFRVAGISLCGTAHAGATLVSAESDRTVSLAGGLGLLAGTRFLAGRVTVAPFVGVRALGARTSGDVLGESVSPTGGSIGGEGGVAAALGRGHVALRVSMDRFDPALGATPYPRLAIRLSAGWRF